MLKEIYISDFALMDNIHISFYSNFNVITGETGAGKSNLIDAIGILIGQRAREEYVRNGKEQAQVEAVFDITDNIKLKEMLASYGIEETDEILISRTINRKGKNSCRINGHLLTISQLADIASRLIEIQGQHEHHSLLSSSKHLDILDNFCGKSVLSMREQVGKSYRELKSIQQEIDNLKTGMRERIHKIDFLNFEIKEIEDACLEDGEEEELVKEKIFLSNIEKINYLFSEIYNIIDKDRGFDSILKMLREISGMDENINSIFQRFENIYYESEDVFDEMRSYGEKLEYDPLRLEDILSRLSIINKLKYKYGNSIKEILSYLDGAKKELESLSISDAHVMELEEKERSFKAKLFDDMEKLSQKRKKGAMTLEKNIHREFKDIGMEKAVFRVNFSDTEMIQIHEYGKDRVEFLFSGNPGEPLKSLSKIASGGEMSRIMLAIKSGLSKIRFTPTLIFDEVDTGLGGEAASKIGLKLSSLSSSSQLICVTHLPQIACHADWHFYIFKTENNSRTISQIKELSFDERVEEISRMLEGENRGETSNALALKMLKLKSKT